MRISKTTYRMRNNMFVPILLLCLAFTGLRVNAQHTQVTPVAAAQSDDVFEVVEQMPEYPGGIGALMEFIQTHLKYPADAHKAGEEGRVIVQFVVEKDGTPSNFAIVRGVTASLNEEALRILKEMPKWKPGTQKGEAVRVRFTIPIVYALTKDDSKPVTKIDEVTVTAYNIPGDPALKDEPVYEVVEQMPSFPAGDAGLMRYLDKNIVYPISAQKDKKEGKVVLKFVIDKQGAVRNIQVLQSASPELDAEAIRVVSAMPKWKPGKEKGQTVNVSYTFPVVFRLK